MRREDGQSLAQLNQFSELFPNEALKWVADVLDIMFM
jgi:hypothetical protein